MSLDMIKVSETMQNISQIQKDIVFGFIKSCQSRKQIIPLETVDIICILYAFPKLIIAKNTKFTMNGNNHCSLIHIKENGILTVDEWNIERKNGGILVVFCENIILEKGATIDLKAKGYKGGKQGYSGHSYKGTSKRTREANFGGGGGEYGGGGGYGSRAKDGWHNYNSGGRMYGDKQLSILHLGSGGGGEYYNIGGSGGGALKIQCLSNIIMKEDTSISCNGGDGSGRDSGGGSGGSIHIIVKSKYNIQMNESSSITAQGGKNTSVISGGGIGRIRIEYMSSNDSKNNCKKLNIRPQPFVG
eukprot:439275_1